MVYNCAVYNCVFLSGPKTGRKVMSMLYYGALTGLDNHVLLTAKQVFSTPVPWYTGVP